MKGSTIPEARNLDSAPGPNNSSGPAPQTAAPPKKFWPAPPSTTPAPSVPGAVAGNGALSFEALRGRVLEVFADVTRYPQDILDFKANLEEDLGIDSVKLGEIFAVLREQYDLPEEIDIAPEDLMRIDGVCQALHQYLSVRLDSAPGPNNSSGPAPQTAAPPKKFWPAPPSTTPAPSVPGAVAGNGALSFEALRGRVLEVFADVTRYPQDILDFKANLEEDLGIDSVKLGEIFAVLREQYDLPEEIDIAPEDLMTIDGVCQALHQYLSVRLDSAPGPNNSSGPAPQTAAPPKKFWPAPPSTTPAPSVPGAVAGNGALSFEALRGRVLEVFADVTRYPQDILDFKANLEEDLGIDSVKLGEIFAVLREQYDLPEEIDIAPEDLMTIDGVCQALHQYLSVRLDSAPGPNNSSGPAPQTAAPPKKFWPAPPSTTPAPSVPGAVAGNGALSFEALRGRVLEVFADVTRYPQDILDFKANLEEDLGIDSVKLGEIFAVLREQYDLPEEIDIAPEDLMTIDGVCQALHQYLSVRLDSAPGPNNSSGPAPQTAAPPKKFWPAPPSTTPAPSVPGAVAGNGALSFEALRGRVLEVFADVTRYPQDILDFKANLEEDLGIDSVKLGEIFAVLREQYDLPEEIDIAPEDLMTIDGVCQALHQYLSVRLDSAPGPNNSSGPAEIGRVEQAPTIVAQDALHAVSFAANTPDVKPFRGKIGFISGSGRGLGKDMAVYLAELGATIVVNSFHSRALGEETTAQIKDAGGEAWHLWGSMANPVHIHKMFDQVEERYGTLNFFISNASNGMLAKIEDLTAEHWEKAFRTNVVGLHQGAVRAARLMKNNGGGKIITMSSPAAHGYVDYFGCMGPVKAAVESLTRTLAIELAQYDIQVTCVSPGPIPGELLEKWPESERLVAQWQKATPYHRLCQHRDVSHFVGYLLSDAVKLFTGSVLVMDGGISVSRF